MSAQCGQLLVHMYGTRPAADGWHGEFSTTLESFGMVMGSSSACVFRHKTRQLICTVHGDDFTVLGYESDLDWFRREINARYEVKFRGRIGPAKGMIRA